MKSLVLVWVLLAATVAWAAPAGLSDEKRAQAREHYNNGTKKFNVAKFAEAAEEFVAAYEIVGEPSLLYNIAQSYRMAEQHERALFFFKSFLRQLDPKSPLRPEVEKRIAELTTAVEQAKHAATSPPTGTIKPEQMQTKPETTETKPETKPEAKPETKPQPPPEVAQPKPASPPPPALKWAGVALLGVGVVGLVVGGGMSGAAKHDSDLLTQASQMGANNMGVAFNSSLQKAQQNGPLYDTLSYVFYGIGGAAAVAGAVTLYLGLRKPAASGRAQLAPMVSPNLAGLAVKGTF